MTRTRGVELDDVESQILAYFEESGTDQSYTSEIAENCGITRHTAAKYLSVLEAKDILGHERVGNAKVWYPVSREIDIRTLTSQDFEEIIEVSERIQGVDGSDGVDTLTNLRAELRTQLADDNDYCIGAESQDEIVGFIIGDERSWEFGSPEKVGWIRILGVHPDYQNRGMGQLLGEEILERFDRAGVKRVRTVVEWDQSDLLPFFHSLDFGMKEAAVLEKKFETDHDTNE